MKKMNKKGFTLIEMLVVIAIVAVLVAIVIPTVTSSTNKATAAANAANLRSLKAEITTAILSGDVKLTAGGDVTEDPAIDAYLDRVVNSMKDTDGDDSNDEFAVTYDASNKSITITWESKTINDFAAMAEGREATTPST